MKKAHLLQLSNCENCGRPDMLDFYKFVFQGITLCDDCADLSASKIKKGAAPWVRIADQFYPPDLPIVKRFEENGSH